MPFLFNPKKYLFSRQNLNAVCLSAWVKLRWAYVCEGTRHEGVTTVRTPEMERIRVNELMESSLAPKLTTNKKQESLPAFMSTLSTLPYLLKRRSRSPSRASYSKLPQNTGLIFPYYTETPFIKQSETNQRSSTNSRFQIKT